MPKYKLYYFNSKGAAESARLLFAYTGIEYEDIRMKDREDFAANYKSEMPTGKLPVLEVDGQKYPESGAIMRFLAREFKLYGKDNREAFCIDAVLDVMNDIRTAVMKVFMEPDETKKTELKKKAVDESIPAVLTLLENLAAGDVFVGDSITVADIAFFRIMEVVPEGVQLDKYPKLKSIHEKVAGQPQIAAWVEKRPKTPY